MKNKEPTLDALLTTLTDAVVTQYESDPTRAGLSVSHLVQGWYVSVVRYRDKFGGGKTVVVSATKPTLQEAVLTLARTWHDLVTSKARLGIMAVHMDGGG